MASVPILHLWKQQKTKGFFQGDKMKTLTRNVLICSLDWFGSIGCEVCGVCVPDFGEWDWRDFAVEDMGSRRNKKGQGILN